DFEETILVDEYVPLSIKWSNPADKYRNPVTYWRMGDSSRSCIEIGIDSKDGSIRDFTLLLSENNVYQQTELQNKPIIFGQPMFDISTFVDKYNDIMHPFLVQIMSNSISITITEQENEFIVKSQRT